MQKRIKFEKIFPFCFILAVAVLLFWKFFIYGQAPFPGDFLLAWYEPWKSESLINETLGIPHKPVADDVFRQLYPFKILATSLLKDGQLPLWNPYNGSGMPFMATMHMGFLNPMNILFFFFSGPTAWTIYIMVQPLLVGVFTYLYCRKINLSIYASLFSSVAFMFSGFVIARIIFGEYIYVIALMPLLLYIIESFIQQPKSKKILFIPFIIFSLFVSGQPQMVFYVSLLSFFYGFYRFIQDSKRIKIAGKDIFFLLTLILIGIGLSSIQLMPTLELFFNAAISPATSKFIFDRFLLPPYHLISLFIPNYFGNQATYNYWGAGDYIETVGSIGTIPLFFAFLSIVIKRENPDSRTFFFIVAVLSIISTLDWLGSRLLFSLPIPVVATGVPSRIFVLTTFSLIVLAGYGFDSWQSIKNIKKSLLYKLLIFVLFIFIVFGITFLFYKTNLSCNNAFILNCRMIALRNTILEVITFTVIFLCTLAYIYFQQGKIRKILPFFIIVIITTLGLYNANKFLPFSDMKTFLPKNDVIETLQNKTQQDRIFSIGEATIKTDFATYYKYFDPNYYDPLYIKRYGEFVSFANTGDVSANLSRSDVEIVNQATVSGSLDMRRNRLLSLLNVGYIIGNKSQKSLNEKETIVWGNDKWYIAKINTLPRAYLVNDYELITDRKNILNRLFDKDFDPQKKVILEKKPTVSLEKINLNTSTTTISTYKENTVTLTVAATQNNLLVLSDNYYPGWKAFVDEKETPIYRANYTFRAIAIPKGDYTITFMYVPTSVTLGIFLSLCSLIVYLFVIRKFLLFYKK